MPLTITCTDGTTSVSTTLSDELVNCVDLFRQTIGRNNDQGVFTLTYADIPTMFAAIVNQYIVVPALRLNPLPSILTAQKDADDAQAALAAAQAAAIPAFTPVG